jgi:hypothetical protein
MTLMPQTPLEYRSAERRAHNLCELPFESTTDLGRIRLMCLFGVPFKQSWPFTRGSRSHRPAMAPLERILRDA